MSTGRGPLLFSLGAGVITIVPRRPVHVGEGREILVTALSFLFYFFLECTLAKTNDGTKK